jgi:hypothetical protein
MIEKNEKPSDVAKTSVQYWRHSCFAVI